LGLVRGLQVLGVLTSAVLNGFLLVYIHLHKLGLSASMFTLEILVSGNTVALSPECC
jgi:hypothetical protein